MLLNKTSAPEASAKFNLPEYKYKLQPIFLDILKLFTHELFENGTNTRFPVVSSINVIFLKNKKKPRLKKAEIDVASGCGSDVTRLKEQLPWQREKSSFWDRVGRGNINGTLDVGVCVYVCVYIRASFDKWRLKSWCFRFIRGDV